MGSCQVTLFRSSLTVQSYARQLSAIIGILILPLIDQEDHVVDD
jgi:hypothetical protein